MTETPPAPPPQGPDDAPPPAHPGERIAKHLARAGVASRREVERMVAEGRIAVNGAVITSPALNVGPKDKITVDGQPVAEAEPARLWLYHKPAGLVTTTRDEQGRATIYDDLPEDLPRVMPVGRLDLTSEGLLLLTNDGGVKRKLELPSTGWLRKYRVRVNGTPDEAALAPLRRGIQIEGERFQPMEVEIDRQQGANAWLTVAIREGRNREIRRAMEAIGLVVNRLIRISYGPFRLGTLKAGAVEEVRQKVLREQLGMERPETGPGGDAGRKPGEKPRGKAAAKGGPRTGAKPGPKTGPKTGERSGGDRPRGKAGAGGKPQGSGRPGAGRPASGGKSGGAPQRRGPRGG